MARVYESRGLGSADAFLKAASDPAGIRALDPAAKDLEGYLFPETYNVPRKMDAGQLVAQMMARFLAVFDEKMRLEAASRGLSLRDAVDARVDRREGVGAARRSGRWSRPSTRTACASAWACSAIPTVIYALEQAGQVQRQPDEEEPAVRLALQHLPLRGPAAGPDRRARPRVTRGRAQSRAGATTSISSAATTARTSSRRRSRSTTRTSRSGRWTTSRTADSGSAKCASM